MEEGIEDDRGAHRLNKELMQTTGFFSNDICKITEEDFMPTLRDERVRM